MYDAKRSRAQDYGSFHQVLIKKIRPRGDKRILHSYKSIPGQRHKTSNKTQRRILYKLISFY